MARRLGTFRACWVTPPLHLPTTSRLQAQAASPSTTSATLRTAPPTRHGPGTRATPRTKREAAARAEVVRRYGSEAAALAWTPREELLRGAVHRWSVYEKGRAVRWVASVDGHTSESLSPMPSRVAEALRQAYPMPTTVTAAAAELAEWDRRDQDLRLVLEDTTESQLDLPAYLRRELVRDLVEVGLRAQSLDEVTIRQRYYVETEWDRPEIAQAVLLDLQGLLDAPSHEATPPRRSKVTRPPEVHPDLFGG